MKQIRRMVMPFAFLLVLGSLFYISQTYTNIAAANLTAISAPTSCETPLSLDVYYILDLSSSQSYIGATNKLEAAKIAISQANSLINNWNNGSRFGLLTSYSGQNGVGDPPTYEVITTNQLAFRPFWGGLTTSEVDFNNKLTPLTANGENSLASALNSSQGEMETDNEGNQAVFVVLAGGIPTLSNERYLFDEAAINTIPILDGEGGFRPPQEVRVDGGPAEDYPGYFNGETPADIMQIIDDIMAEHPDWTFHAMALQGDPPFNDEILQYIADVGNGIFAAPDNLSDLEASLQQAMENSACDSGITPTPTVTGTPPTSTPIAPTPTDTPTSLPTVASSTPATSTPTGTPTSLPTVASSTPATSTPTDTPTSLPTVASSTPATSTPTAPTATNTVATNTPTNTPTPLLTSISPDSAVANAGNVPVIISGYFQEAVTAKLGSVDLLSVTLASPSTIHALVPVESLSEGVYDLAVQTNGHLLSLADAFTVTESVQQSQFRAMVYLACDNNLADECEGLFNKLELAMLSNPDLRIVAFWDGDEQNDSAYYLVQPDEDRETWAQYTNGINRIPLGEVDSANSDSLVSFAAWANSQYPENYSLLSLVGHGEGWAPDIYPAQILGFGYEWGVGGMFWDERDGNVMSTAALAQALEWISSANQIDVIYLDACLMSSVEVMAELAPYAQYIVAHENIAWATYPYDQYLSNVNASTTPSQLAEHLAQVNYESWPAEGHPGQISVINSNQIENVLTELDTLALELSTTLPAARLTILEIVSDSSHLDENYDWQIDIEDSALDLYDFASQLNSHPEMPAAVKTAAQDVIEALDNTIIANHRQSGTPWPGEQYWDLSSQHGLSLYFPLIDEWKRAYYGPEALPRFASSSAWDDFIQAWYSDQLAPEPPTELCNDCLKAPWQINPSLEQPVGYLLHLPLVQR